MVQTKEKWAKAILEKLKHRDIRVRITKRRELGREPTDIDLVAAVEDRDNDFKNVTVHEVIKAYEDGHEVCC